jgi:hypothetical protein
LFEVGTGSELMEERRWNPGEGSQVTEMRNNHSNIIHGPIPRSVEEREREILHMYMYILKTGLEFRREEPIRNRRESKQTREELLKRK